MLGLFIIVVSKEVIKIFILRSVLPPPSFEIEDIGEGRVVIDIMALLCPGGAIQMILMSGINVIRGRICWPQILVPVTLIIPVTRKATNISRTRIKPSIIIW